MYGDEFVEKPKIKLYLSSIPLNNRDRCNPLFRVHKSEWVHDKIERKSDISQIHHEQNKPKTPIHEREAKIKLIELLQLQKNKGVIK